jgi:hypothetical protein
MNDVIDSTQTRTNDGAGPSFFFFTIDGVMRCYIRYKPEWLVQSKLMFM